MPRNESKYKIKMYMHEKQGLCQDSEAPTFNEQTIQSVDKTIMPSSSSCATKPMQETINK